MQRFLFLSFLILGGCTLRSQEMTFDMVFLGPEEAYDGECRVSNDSASVSEEILNRPVLASYLKPEFRQEFVRGYIRGYNQNHGTDYNAAIDVETGVKREGSFLLFFLNVLRALPPAGGPVFPMTSGERIYLRGGQLVKVKTDASETCVKSWFPFW